MHRLFKHDLRVARKKTNEKSSHVPKLYLLFTDCSKKSSLK